MGGLRTTFTALTITAALAGCTSPQLAGTSWSEERGTALPERREATTAGALVVKTETATRLDEFEKENRGFAVFNANGALVHSENGCSGLERLRLAPGRYVVVSLVGQGAFDRHLERVQAIVAAGSETRVDFTLATPATVATRP